MAQVMFGEAKPFVPVNLLAKCFSQLAIAAFWNSLSFNHSGIDFEKLLQHPATSSGAGYEDTR